MSSDERKIMRAVGKPVRFTYPGGEGRRRGILKSREIAYLRRRTGARYWAVVDVVAFDGESEPRLRVGYYRKPVGASAPMWASQTTICTGFSKWRNAILPAIAKLMEKAKDSRG